MDSNAIEAQAAQWLVKKHNDDWTDEQQQELDSWLEESTAHLVSYLRLEEALRQTDRLAAFRGSAPEGVVPPPGAWSTAATQCEVAAAKSERPAPHKWRFRWLAIAAALGTLVVGGVYLLLVTRTEYRQRYATRVGDLAVVALADGSRVTLNTGTQIRVSLAAHERSIELDAGEAFFTVAKDPSRPFVIHVADKKVIAIGTELSVRRMSGPDSDIQVVVTEGQVQVQPGAGAASDRGVAVNAGTMVHTLHHEVFAEEIAPAQTERMLSWRSGFVTFHNTALAEAVSEFNRYSHRELVIADPSIAAIRISGKFRCGNVEAFLALLQQGFPVTAQESDKRVFLRRNHP